MTSALLILLTLLVAGFICCSATASPRSSCVEVRDPGVGTYRICAPAPRRR